MPEATKWQNICTGDKLIFRIVRGRQKASGLVHHHLSEWGCKLGVRSLARSPEECTAALSLAQHTRFPLGCGCWRQFALGWGVRSLSPAAIAAVPTKEEVPSCSKALFMYQLTARKWLSSLIMAEFRHSNHSLQYPTALFTRHAGKLASDELASNFWLHTGAPCGVLIEFLSTTARPKFVI